MTMDDDDRQSVAEALDQDKLADRDDYSGDDPVVGFPPERPLGSGRQTLTPTDEAFGESVVERDRRTNPDPLADELDAAARGDAGPGGPDEPLDADVPPEAPGDRVGDDVGQLVDGHPADDDRDGVGAPRHDDGRLIAEDRAPAADRPAEEAAVHVEPEVREGGAEAR